jgi:NADH-quinone oxidoreductase subunit E
MSQSAGPLEFTPESMMKPMSDMQSWMIDMARSSPAARMMSPLMTHPTAATAAATALGLGAASQMMGFMMGSMQGAMDASRRMGVPVGPFDMTAGLKAFDAEWIARFGDAALETAQEAARTAGDVAEKVNAEVRQDVAAVPARSARVARKTNEAAAAIVSATAEAAKATERAVTRAAEPVTPVAVVAAAEKAAEAPVSASPAEAVKMAAPRKMDKPATPDDLKQIAGVGPKLEEVLNRLGVWSFAQIAGWTPAEIAWVDDYLQCRGRIERDDWLGQARGLAGKK